MPDYRRPPEKRPYGYTLREYEAEQKAMTKDLVSEELVEIAIKAIDNVIDNCKRMTANTHADSIRAALNAVAPRLRAEGMRKAAGLVDRAYDADRILACAAALDPQKEGK